MNTQCHTAFEIMLGLVQTCPRTAFDLMLTHRHRSVEFVRRSNFFRTRENQLPLGQE